MQSIVKTLLPTWKVILLFLIFLAIVMGGKIQAWVFTAEPPKPPLYDLLSPFPIWEIWITLLIPLAILVYPLKLLGLDLMGGSPAVFIAANITYFYILSCLLVAGLDWIKNRWRPPGKVV